jgi:hypothetical protein
VRRGWLLVCLMLSACSDERLASAVPVVSGISGSSELIPAEWTVREDTSAAGEVITASVQLPASKDIAGLMHDGAPRLTLRCMGGKVAVFIDTEPSDSGGESDSSSSRGLISIQLDSAPSCE